ncbi:MAG: FAD-dependent oxidoreductase [Firmicutes bacterium]|nr:FAD-dependent oxidoreductase [Bacillota bacterium]
MEMMTMNSYDCIVIGAGVAGMTAALYLKRSGINVLLIEREMPGGVLNKTTEIENYPGFTKINGTDLALSIYEQIKNQQIEYKYGNVVEIVCNGEEKIVKTNRDEFKTKNIILATGRTPRKLGLSNEEKLIGHGISYCAICDGSFFKDKEVALVGGGNSALTGALYLSNITSKVYIINRSDKLKADEILQSKIKEKSNIEILFNSKVTNINEKDNVLDSVDLNNKELNVKGLFIYIGFDPDINYLKNLNIKTKNGYIEVDEDMQTNIKGIYACGDIVSKKVYQISTAIGEAAIAATSIKNND